MTKHSLCICLAISFLWPTSAQEIPSLPVTRVVYPERIETVSVTEYLATLSSRGFKIDTQGILIESLDGSVVFADHNSGVAFNPASVIKVATSFAALSRFGPGRRFETVFFADGRIDKKTRTLHGDLILSSDGDPAFNTRDLRRLANELVRAAVHRVTGDLVIAGPFTIGNLDSKDEASRYAQRTLRRLGIRISGSVQAGSVRGTPVATHTSPTLQDILLYQNAHSSNPIAERLGAALGGPYAVERFLVGAIGMAPWDVSVGRTSGLQYNRITPRDTILLLRKLIQWLETQSMRPEDILPVAGIDPGTLQTRFRAEDYRGAIVAKTGTLLGTDGGVSTLAGIVYTRGRGPILFAIFNTKGSVRRYRKLQDQFLQDFIDECGGTDPAINVSSRRPNN